MGALTRRNAEVLVRHRLTLAILLGSPVLVTAMMAMLFQTGAFEPHGAAGVGPPQIVFWVAFAGCFFGLTYGLLQIVGEMESGALDVAGTTGPHRKRAARR